MKKHQVKYIVQNKYGEIVKNNNSSCCHSSTCCGSNLSVEDISGSLGYTMEEMRRVPLANLGLGCGNPVAFSNINKGDVVLDLGCGAGFDSFLAAEKVGFDGKVIGIDLTEGMINKAKENAKVYNYSNIEFIHGNIEQLPIPNDSIDKIISNCVINLSPNKKKVFKEAYRVLKPMGKLFFSDIVLLEELSSIQRNDPDLIAGCVGGAMLREEYLELIKKTGFQIRIISEDKEISKKQHMGINIESLSIEASKS